MWQSVNGKHSPLTDCHVVNNTPRNDKNFIQTIEEGRKTSEDVWAFIWDSDVGRKRPMYLGVD